jgi:hypothetical protein
MPNTMPLKKLKQPISDVAVYIVLDEFNGGRCAYREVDQAKADENNVIEDIIRGTYFSPVRVLAFNVGQGWVRDVTTDIALAVLKRARSEHHVLSQSAQVFVEKVLGQNASMRALV